VFGPVPTKYQLFVWLCGLSVFAGLAALTAHAAALSATAMVAFGLMIGACAVALFLHDFAHPHQAPARRRHH
jgi:hypothetical protein